MIQPFAINRSTGYCQRLSRDELMSACEELDAFRRDCENLYQRVRALFFLYPFIVFICRENWWDANAV